MICPFCNTSMPDAARFCGACGRSLSISRPSPAFQSTKRKPLLDILPNALQGAVLPLASVAFGLHLFDALLSATDASTPFLGAVMPIGYYGCWTALLIALWDGLRRLANPLAPLAGIAAIACAFAAPQLSGGLCLLYTDTNLEFGEILKFSFAVSAVAAESVVSFVQFVLGASFVLHHSGRARTFGFWLAVESVVTVLSEAVDMYLFAGVLSGDLEGNEVSGIFEVFDFLGVVMGGLALFFLCRVLSSAMWPETPTNLSDPNDEASK